MKNDKVSFKDRLIEFLAYLKIGQGAFEANTGISNGSISKIKDGMSTASIDKIMAVYPALNIEWLISGSGEMIKSTKPSTPNEKEGHVNGDLEEIKASLRTNEILLQSLHEEIYVMQRFQVWLAINTSKIQDSEVFDKLDSIRNDFERSRQ